MAFSLVNQLELKHNALMSLSAEELRKVALKTNPNNVATKQNDIEIKPATPKTENECTNQQVFLHAYSAESKSWDTQVDHLYFPSSKPISILTLNALGVYAMHIAERMSHLIHYLEKDLIDIVFLQEWTIPCQQVLNNNTHVQQHYVSLQVDAMSISLQPSGQKVSVLVRKHASGVPYNYQTFVMDVPHYFRKAVALILEPNEHDVFIEMQSKKKQASLLTWFSSSDSPMILPATHHDAYIFIGCHLQSESHLHSVRKKQLLHLLHQFPKIPHTMIVGDYNLHYKQENDKLTEIGLTDVWTLVHGDKSEDKGNTYHQNTGIAYARLDRICVKQSLTPTIKNIRVVLQEQLPIAHKDPVFVSDHFGLVVSMNLMY